MSEEIGEEDATMMTIDDPPAPPATATTPTDFLDHEPSKQEKIEVRRFQDSVLFLVQIPRSDSIVCRNIYGTVVETPLGNSVVEGICIAVFCFFAMERGGYVSYVVSLVFCLCASRFSKLDHHHVDGSNPRFFLLFFCIVVF